MKDKSIAGRQILHNKKVHDSVVSSYEDIHVEIYNPTEQGRISSILEEAITQIKTRVEVPLVLDFGAGTGNLTRNLLNLGAEVLAADVSRKSLASLELAFGGTGRIDTVELNGVDLANLEDSSVDMIATYSVLHHVPDYLEAVREFARVVKPGGVIYIDHENAPSVWLDDCDEYTAYKQELQAVHGKPLMEKLAHKFKCLFSPKAWKRVIDRELHGLIQEGDIHVFEHDHIEWDRIEQVLLRNCTILKSEDYLVCREPSTDPPLHAKHEAKCVDMRVIVSRKNRL